jgi:hypothetical protein
MREQVQIHDVTVPMCDDCDQPADYMVRHLKGAIVRNVAACYRHVQRWQELASELERSNP